MRPLIRWMGGKQFLAGDIIAAMDLPKGQITRLVEPFCGALGFTCTFAANFPGVEIHVSDAEQRVIGLWTACQRRPLDLQASCAMLAAEWESLPTHDARKTWFYNLRKRYNAGLVKDRDAAFLCMMKVGFSGLMRSNAKGHFTTTIGFYKEGQMFRHGEIPGFGLSLSRRWSIFHRSYERAIASVIPGCVVYLDPPYRGTFNDYSTEVFDSDFLPEFMRRCVRAGARLVAMSQSQDERYWRKVLPEAQQVPMLRVQGANSDSATEGHPTIEETLLIMRGRTA